MIGDSLALQQSALVALIVTILGLLAIAVAVSVYAAVLRLRHEARDRRWARLGAAWREPLLEALDDPSQVPAVQRTIAPKRRLDFVNFVLGFARQVRGEQRATLRRLVDPFLDPIARRSYSGRGEIRTRAVQTLGTLGLPRYAKQVIDALDDPSPVVAMVAARSLARREFIDYADEVFGHLARFETWSRRFIGSMLASMGPDAAQSLRAVFDDEDEEPWVRAVAADALRLLIDLGSGDAAARVVELEDNRELIASALRLLSAVGRPEHAAPVRVRCASPDYVIRAHAWQALGVLSTSEADMADLVAAMSDPSPWVAIHAARGLRAAGRRELLAALAHSDDPRAELAQQVLEEELASSE